MNGKFQNKKIILGVSGSIACYKACDILRRLQDRGADVTVMLTRGAEKFVTALTFSALSGHPVLTEVWDTQNWQMVHIPNANSAHLMLVAPASANLLARVRAGLADDALTATILSAKCPIVFAPAMHEEMWNNPATRNNVETLRQYGYHFAGPQTGALLGSHGTGRLIDTDPLLDFCETVLV